MIDTVTVGITEELMMKDKYPGLILVACKVGKSNYMKKQKREEVPSQEMHKIHHTGAYGLRSHHRDSILPRIWPVEKRIRVYGHWRFGEG